MKKQFEYFITIIKDTSEFPMKITESSNARDGLRSVEMKRTGIAYHIEINGAEDYYTGKINGAKK